MQVLDNIPFCIFTLILFNFVMTFSSIVPLTILFHYFYKHVKCILVIVAECSYSDRELLHTGRRVGEQSQRAERADRRFRECHLYQFGQVQHTHNINIQFIIFNITFEDSANRPQPFR